MLSINNIEVVYDDYYLILQGVSLQVPEGSIVAFLGNNGAGKSTALKAVCGVLGAERGEITDGTIEFMGQEIHKTSPVNIVKMGITMVPENRGIFDEIKTEENLLIGAYQCQSDRKTIKKKLDSIYQLFPALVKHRRRLAVFLSGGEQQMLAIGRALMAEPKIILLDEPSLGLSPILVTDIFSTIKRINTEDKVTILLVEQNAKVAFSLSQYVYIMENGRVVIDGVPEKLAKNEDVKVFYFGGTEESGERVSFHDVKHYKRRKRWL